MEWVERNKAPGVSILSRVAHSRRLGPWLLADFLWAVLAFFLASLGGRQAELPAVQLDNLLAAFSFASSFGVVALGFALYDPSNRFSRVRSARGVILCALLALPLSISLLHFVFFVKVGRFALVFGFIAASLALLVWHLVLASALRRFPLRFVVLGQASSLTSQLLKESTEQRHTNLLQDFESERLVTTAFQDRQSLDSAIEHLKYQGVSDLVLTQNSYSQDPRVLELGIAATERGLRVVSELDFVGEHWNRYPPDLVNTHWILQSGINTPRPYHDLLKRSLDLGLSLSALAVLWPVLLVFIAMIRLSSRGPAMYRQVRQGLHKRPFVVWKLRTMVHDADKSGAATQSLDPRVTRLGAWLRRFHLDELPQLWNIIRGDMSFVGPRPEAMEIVERLRSSVPLFEVRHWVKPGLTGLAQITQGKTLDGAEESARKLSFDLYYIRHSSLAFDLWILLRTAFVLRSKTW
jgi:exopolysaccharide biosynthesis polyprenyl glycosylphosphotransferase